MPKSVPNNSAPEKRRETFAEKSGRLHDRIDRFREEAGSFVNELSRDYKNEQKQAFIQQNAENFSKAEFDVMLKNFNENLEGKVKIVWQEMEFFVKRFEKERKSVLQALDDLVEHYDSQKVIDSHLRQLAEQAMQTYRDARDGLREEFNRRLEVGSWVPEKADENEPEKVLSLRKEEIAAARRRLKLCDETYHQIIFSPDAKNYSKEFFDRIKKFGFDLISTQELLGDLDVVLTEYVKGVKGEKKKKSTEKFKVALHILDDLEGKIKKLSQEAENFPEEKKIMPKRPERPALSYKKKPPFSQKETFTKVKKLVEARLPDDLKLINKITDTFEFLRSPEAAEVLPDLKVKADFDLAVAEMAEKYIEVSDLFNKRKKLTDNETKQLIKDYDASLREAEKFYRETVKKYEYKLNEEVDKRLVVLNSPKAQDKLSEEDKARVEEARERFYGQASLDLEELVEMRKDLNSIKATVLRKPELEINFGEVAKRYEKEAEDGAAISEMVVPEEIFNPTINFSPEDFSAKEMLREEGMIDLRGDQILALFGRDELQTMTESVIKDAATESQANKENFKELMRQALKEKILNTLEKEKRDQLVEMIAAEAYDALKGEVLAEAQREMSVRLADTDRRAKVAGLVGRAAIIAAVGTGAAMTIGTGGLAAATTAGAVALSRIVFKNVKPARILKEKTGNWLKKVFAKKESADQWLQRRIFSKEEVFQSVAEKIITPENLAAIVSNQLKESSNEKITDNIKKFIQSKENVLRHPTGETMAAFEKNLTVEGKEFYRNAYEYFAAEHTDKKLSEKTLATMAMCATKNFLENQRNEALNAAVSQENSQTFETLERMAGKVIGVGEKVLELRSQGIGSFAFGMGLAYAVAETSTTGRIVSGAVGGIGLGLMAEKALAGKEQNKRLAETEKIITNAEKMGWRFLTPDALEEAKRNAHEIQANITLGVFEDSKLLKNRAKNFVDKVETLAILAYEKPGWDAEEITKDIAKRAEKLINEVKKNHKKKKNIRKAMYIFGGAVVGAGLGAILGKVMPELKKVIGAHSFAGSKDSIKEDWSKMFPAKETRVFPSASADQLKYVGAAQEVVASPSAQVPAVQKYVGMPWEAEASAPVASAPTIPHSEAIPETPPLARPSTVEKAVASPVAEKTPSVIEETVTPKTKQEVLQVARTDDEHNVRAVDLYTKAGEVKAQEYLRLVESGKINQADKLFEQAMKETPSAAPVRSAVEETAPKPVDELSDKELDEEVKKVVDKAKAELRKSDMTTEMLNRMTPKTRGAYQWIEKNLENSSLTNTEKKQLDDWFDQAKETGKFSRSDFKNFNALKARVDTRETIDL